MTKSSDETDKQKKKGLPKWGISLIIICSIILLIGMYMMIPKLLKMRKDSISNVNIINNTPQKIKKLDQRKKIQNFKENYKQTYRKFKNNRAANQAAKNQLKLRNKNTLPMLRPFMNFEKKNRQLNKKEINITNLKETAIKLINDATNKQSFNLERYETLKKQFKKNNARFRCERPYSRKRRRDSHDYEVYE